MHHFQFYKMMCWSRELVLLMLPSVLFRIELLELLLPPPQEYTSTPWKDCQNPKWDDLGKVREEKTWAKQNIAELYVGSCTLIAVCCHVHHKGSLLRLFLVGICSLFRGGIRSWVADLLSLLHVQKRMAALWCFIHSLELLVLGWFVLLKSWQ